MVEPEGPQKTPYAIEARIHACTRARTCIYVILVGFPWHQWLRESSAVLRILPVLFHVAEVNDCFHDLY